MRKRKNSKQFTVFYKDFFGSITIENGKIARISYEQNGISLYECIALPTSTSFLPYRNNVFNLMCIHETEKFKDMLRRLEVRDHENYNFGLSVLKKQKEQAKGNSSKFDL